MKNLTLAGSRTQVPGFSSADAVTAMQRVPRVPLRSVGRSNFVRVCVNLTTLIQKLHILMRTAVYIYVYTSDQLQPDDYKLFILLTCSNININTTVTLTLTLQ